MILSISRERRARKRGRISGVVLDAAPVRFRKLRGRMRPAAQVLGDGLFHIGVMLQVCGSDSGASLSACRDVTVLLYHALNYTVP